MTDSMPEFVQVREAVAEIAESLVDAGSQLEEELDERFNVTGLVRRFQQRVAGESFYIAMLGAHGTGKSAFLNQVTGERILKEDVPATTSAIVILKHGESRRVTVTFKPRVTVDVWSGVFHRQPPSARRAAGSATCSRPSGGLARSKRQRTRGNKH